MTEMFVAFVAAFVWAGATALDAPETDPLEAVIAVFGCASVVFVPALLAWRRAAPRGRGVEPDLPGPLTGVALSALPLALAGKLLFEKTHHRALGGVTFAFVALVVIAFCVLLARRIQREPSWGAVPRLVFGASAFGSTAVVVVWLFGSVLRAPQAFKVAAVDFTTGAALLAMASRAPVERLPAWTRRAALGGVLAALGGIALFALNQDLRRHVAEAAPVATFVVRVLLF